MSEPAPEIIMDARGIYWRRYPTYLSMVPVSDDNEPVPHPYIVYRRVGQETEHGFASTATGDLLARAERAESELAVARHALSRIASLFGEEEEA